MKGVSQVAALQASKVRRPRTQVTFEGREKVNGLIDTGAEVSTLDVSVFAKLGIPPQELESGEKVHAANKSTIVTLGRANLKVSST